LNQTDIVSLNITPLQIFNQPARKFPTFKAAGDPFSLGAKFNFAFSAILALVSARIETSGAYLVASAHAHMLVAHRAIHAARREHVVINFVRHFHAIPPIPTMISDTQ
jgi:hypothetical protein